VGHGVGRYFPGLAVVAVNSKVEIVVVVKYPEFGFFGGRGAGYREDLGEGREGDGFLPDQVGKVAVDGGPLCGADSLQGG